MSSILGKKISWKGTDYRTVIKVVGNNDEKIFLEILKSTDFVYDVLCKTENRLQILESTENLRIKVKKSLLKDLTIELSIEIMDPYFGLIFSSVYKYTDEDMKIIEKHYNKDSQ